MFARPVEQVVVDRQVVTEPTPGRQRLVDERLQGVPRPVGDDVPADDVDDAAGRAVDRGVDRGVDRRQAENLLFFHPRR